MRKYAIIDLKQYNFHKIAMLGTKATLFFILISNPKPFAIFE